MNMWREGLLGEQQLRPAKREEAEEEDCEDIEDKDDNTKYSNGMNLLT